MTQQHLDRLTAVDASFLHQEGQNTHMHVGAIMTFEGKPPSIEAFLDHIRGRLHLVPRYRQKLAFPPLQSGRPVWVDDPSFNLDYHIRHTALPAPGSEEQLFNLAARIFSQQLDRAKPLWEMWLVQGLEGNRFALIGKTHHSVVDGVGGVDLTTVLFDISAKPTAIANSGEPWHPSPEPSSSELLTAGIRGLAKTTAKLAERAVKIATHPEAAAGTAKEALEGVGEIVWAGMNPAPETPLNVEIGPHRRLAVVRHQLQEYKRVKDVFGGTVNDVVLTVVSGALGSFLRSRGVRTEGLEMRALVPISIRSEDEHNQLGNRIAAMRGPLPTYIEDPVARLRVVRKSMDGLKESKQAIGAEVLSSVENMAPPTVLAQASRLNFSTRLFNLIVTNVPGPQFPLYVLGHELRELFPIAFLPKDHALAIGVMSYNGELNYGLLGDYDAVPDIDNLADEIRESLDELARAANGRPAGKPVRKKKPPAKKKTPAKK